MAALSDTLKSLASGLLAKKSRSVLGIDISSSTIKVVQLGRKKGKAILETYGELALGPYAGVDSGRATSLSSSKLGEAVADLIREAKVSTNACGVAIPLSASLINVLEMPDVAESRLKEMVPLEVRKYIPVSISEVTLDWRIVPKLDMQGAQASAPAAGAKKIEILTVAIHKDTILRYQEVMQKAGLAPSFYEIEVFSSIRVALEEDLQPVMILGMGAGSTKVYVIDRKVLRESHIINRGSQEVTLAIEKAMGVTEARAEELKRTFGVVKQGNDTDVAEIASLVLDSIFTEAQRVMQNYQKRHSRNVGKVILTGGGIMLPGIVERAGTVFGTEVSVADPFRKVEAPAFLDAVLKQVGPEFDVAIGVALRRLEEEG
ncbi:MAG TPA: type IV pilus assembly protein PilM [Candidatus Paceibacterota bacterium]|nr:type IV pilus assembly protein PilM [Candidatus Paceibacterota bacterium]